MNETPAFEGRITPLMGEYAAQMKPWVRLMSVLSFLGAAFMILVGAGFAFLGTIAESAAQDASVGVGRFGGVGGAVFGVFYALMGLLYVPPGLFLHRTASAIGRMKTGDPAPALETLLKSQKSFWRYVGVMTIIVLCLTVLAFVLGLGAALLIPALSRQS